MAVLMGWLIFRSRPAPDKPQTAAPVAGTSSEGASSAKKSQTEAPDAARTRQVEFPLSPTVGMVFCWIPPGKSRLGSPAGEMKNADHEAEDEHEFSTAGFWLGKYEVTQVEWVAVMRNNPSVHNGRDPNSARGMDTSRFPVEMISWNDAQSFITALNARAGTKDVFGTPGRFVLPTEDEWEYACRGGRGNAEPFYFGKVLDGRQANCFGKKPYGTVTEGPYLGRPTTVGSYAEEYPHPWGLCDMHGNVWEFCDSDRPRPAGKRVLRGASYGDQGAACRAASRNFFGPDTHRYFNVGMRVCYRPR
jgi:formylglycine-generating enzyme required for sulfatase activity